MTRLRLLEALRDVAGSLLLVGGFIGFCWLAGLAVPR